MPRLRQGDGGVCAVLYVDDEEMACKYFARAMAHEYQVLTATGAEQALAMLAASGHGIGVLVSDYRMPGRNGGALLRHVNQHYPQLVCLMVTAYADKALLLDSINGADVFRVLEKPLDMATLRLALRDACERARERQTRRDNLRAIGETLGFLAHELNTPLAAIANFARGIERRAALNPFDGDARSALAAQLSRQQADIGVAAALVHDNARYCLSVLSSFIDTVRRAHGGSDGDRAGRSACDLLESLLDAYPLTPEQRAMLRCDTQQDFLVTALPNCVALVLTAILNNALRALDGRPGAAVRLSVLAEPSPRILVRDNGPGIAPAVLERLLVDPVTTHADAGGNGVGLIFCQRIMQSFGGSIAVESEAGHSTTVTLHFPPLSPVLQTAHRNTTKEGI